MKAAFKVGKEEFDVREVETPDIKPDESNILERLGDVEERLDSVQAGYERMLRVLTERMENLQSDVREDRLFIAHELMGFKKALHYRGIRGIIYRLKERIRRPEDRESEVKK